LGHPVLGIVHHGEGCIHFEIDETTGDEYVIPKFPDN